MRRVFLPFCVCVLVGSGCSAVARISDDANEIRNHADSTVDHLETIIVEADGNDVVVDEAARAIDDQAHIIELVADIHKTIPGVQDATPWWASLINNVMLAAAVLGVVFLVWHLGIGHLIKRVFWSIGMFIPAAAKRAAEMDLKVEEDKVTYREAVASRRSGDAAYEAARKLARRRGE